FLQPRVNRRQFGRLARLELGARKRARSELRGMRVQQNYEVDLDPALPEILGGVDHEVEPIKETTGVPGSEIPHCPRCCEPAPVFVHARSPCSPTASLARRRRASFSR